MSKVLLSYCHRKKKERAKRMKRQDTIMDKKFEKLKGSKNKRQDKRKRKEKKVKRKKSIYFQNS